MPRFDPESVQLLVVDSYSGWRDGLAAALREAGYRVQAFRTAAEALQWSARGGLQIDLLLTETELLDMDGGVLGRRLRQTHPRLRVVFMSYAFDGPGGELLGKPFSLHHLERTIEAALTGPPQRSITEVLSSAPPSGTAV